MERQLGLGLEGEREFLDAVFLFRGNYYTDSA
jgi:hypothetical protein